MSEEHGTLHQQLHELANAFRRHESHCVKNREQLVEKLARIEADLEYTKKLGEENKANIKALDRKLTILTVTVTALIVLIGGQDVLKFAGIV